MRYSVPRKSRRVPLVAPVHLKLEDFPDPVTETVVNVSLGGMRVALAQPSEVGSLVAFEFAIGDALIEGTGEIVWIRKTDLGPEEPRGMGIRFRYLSSGSRERIFRLVQWYAGQKQELSGERVAAAAAQLKPATQPVRPQSLEAGSSDDFEEPEELITDVTEGPAPAVEARQISFADLDDSRAPIAPSQVSPQEPPSFPAPFPAAARSLPPPLVEENPQPVSPPSWPAPPAVAVAKPAMPELPRAPEGPRVEPGSYFTPPRPAEAPAPRPARASDFTASYDGPGHVGAYVEEGGGDRRRTLLLAVILLVLIAVTTFLLRDSIFSWLGMGEDAAPQEILQAPLPTSADQPVGEPGELGTDLPSAVDDLPSTAGELAEGEETSPPAEGEAEPLAVNSPLPAPVPPPRADDPPAGSRPTPGRLPASTSRATKVERITWQRGSGGTVVTIEADGHLPRELWSTLLLGGANPRLLIRIQDIRESYPQLSIAADSPQLARIRTGLHQTPRGSELHIVLDFTAAGVRVAGEVQEVANGLRLTLAGP